MRVSAVIVTRGDVELIEMLASLPTEWERVVWDNGGRRCLVWDGDGGADVAISEVEASDFSVYGRYAAIEHASGDLIYVQDDDCVVERDAAEELVDVWAQHFLATDGESGVVANMPAPFRHDFYADHCLVGFGAVFHRDAPARAWARYREYWMASDGPERYTHADTFQRTCDVVFTALTPRVLVDVPYRNLPWATAPNRMYHNRAHTGERKNMLDLALRALDA